MAIVKVQDAGNNGVSLSSLAVTLTNPTAVGNLLVACIGTTGTATVSSISGGGTWSSAITQAGTGVRVEIWYAPNVSDGVTSITVTLSGADAVAADVSEYSGAAISATLGGTISASGAAANPTTGTATPLSTSDLFVAAACYLPTTSTVSSQTAGWTALTSENASTSLALVDSYQIISNGTSKTDTWTLTPAVATNYAGAIATFLPLSTISKFYLHRSTATNVGTLPAAGTSISATTPTKIATGGDTNRQMDATISAVAQTSNPLTTNAVVTAQASLMLRFISAPIAAQTFAATTRVVAGGDTSNTNSNFNGTYVVGIWRPSTGALVGRFHDIASGAGEIATWNVTSQAFGDTVNQTSSSVTSQDGDCLVVEVWRDKTVQGKSTAYTNTVFYDGTVEGSVSDIAAYLLMGLAIVMQQPGPTSHSRFYRQAVKRAASF